MPSVTFISRLPHFLFQNTSDGALTLKLIPAPIHADPVTSKVLCINSYFWLYAAEVEQLVVDRALEDSGIAQWLERYERMGWFIR